MSKKQLLRVAMTFWLILATACNGAAPAIVTSTHPAMPMTTPTPVPGCKGEEIDLQKYGGALFQSADAITSRGTTLETILEVKYGDNQIASCPVQLRSYNGKLVGPTLRAKPGDTIIITIKNMLPPNPAHQDMSQPHDFNTTNLHTHGLHVSPGGISDNVLRKMPPPADGSKEADYPVVIHIPINHPAGTFWYHPHVHGSTAIQVSSGMAGALIIEGGLDEVPEIKAAQEKIFVFQQIAYDTQGKIEDFNTSLGFLPNGQAQWANLHRQHTINGQLYPTLTMRPGELQRWRLIHAGVEETIMATIYGPSVENLADLESIKKLPVNTLHELAVDGLALGKIDDWSQVELQPGYRSDILVKFEEKGNYYIVDDARDEKESLSGDAESEKLLARIQVAGDPPVMPMLLPQDSELASLKPFKDIGDDEITGYQTAVFCMCKDTTTGKLIFTVNGKPFDEKDQPRQLKLNAVEEWEVSTAPASLAPSHPFHIHVNPFQVMRTGPDGKPEIVWKDTFLITSQDPLKPQKLRMRYQEFTGKFVMHCHILGHEDQGMMELIEVVR